MVNLTDSQFSKLVLNIVAMVAHTKTSQLTIEQCTQVCVVCGIDDFNVAHELNAVNFGDTLPWSTMENELDELKEKNSDLEESVRDLTDENTKLRDEVKSLRASAVDPAAIVMTERQMAQLLWVLRSPYSPDEVSRVMCKSGLPMPLQTRISRLMKEDRKLLEPVAY